MSAERNIVEICFLSCYTNAYIVYIGITSLGPILKYLLSGFYRKFDNSSNEWVTALASLVTTNCLPAHSTPYNSDRGCLLAQQSLWTAQGQEMEKEPTWQPSHKHVGVRGPGGGPVWRRDAVFSEGTVLFHGICPMREVTASPGRPWEKEVKGIRGC